MASCDANGLRQPFAAGMFYPASKDLLNDVLEKAFSYVKAVKGKPPSAPGDLIGFIAPHMGYMYSAPVLARAYCALASNKKPRAVIILGTNHYYPQIEAAVSLKTWATPLGELRVSEGIAMELIEGADVEVEETPHVYEHSIEVHLPFLQYIYGEIDIVPLGLGAMKFEKIKKLSQSLASILSKKKIVVIASTDFTHFEEEDEVRRRDRVVIDRILKLDVKGFYETLGKEEASICGANSIGVLMYLARLTGAHPMLLDYTLSSEVIGNPSNVVGLAVIDFRRCGQKYV